MRNRRHKKRAGALNLPRAPWEGGSGYWVQFSKARAAGWGNPGFFPIAVFLSNNDDGHPTSLQSIGINTYLASEHRSALLTEFDSIGMFSILQSPYSHVESAPDIPFNWSQSEVGSNANVVGWFIYDECEQGEGRCGDWGDDATRLSNHESWTASTRAYADGRFMFANYGNGVLNSFWAVGTMPDWVGHVDACGCDKYAYTSPGVRFEFGRSDDYIAAGGSESNALSSAPYGWMARQMRSFGNYKFPYWSVIESKMPFLDESGNTIITYAQIEGAVWSALTNEARGFFYFQHSGLWGSNAPATDPNTGSAPTTETYSLVDGGSGLRNAVSAVNSAVTAMAIVLNSQSYEWDCEATGVVTMLKKYQGNVYIFASLDVGGATGSKTFTLPANVRGKRVTVMNESRIIAVTGHVFTDTFANEYTHHIYKVAV